MNSYLSPRTRSASAAAVIALLAVAAATGTVRAQSLPPVPATQAQPRVPAPAAPAVPAAPEARTQESFILPQGATIADTAQRVQSLAAEGGKALNDLIGAEPLPREKGQIDSLADLKRQILLLEEQLKLAKLAKELYKELHSQEEGNADEIRRLNEEKAALEEQLRLMQSAPAAAASQPDEPLPVVQSISGAAGNAKAVVLVPYGGVINARVGTVLPNGMKVVSISGEGVLVDREGSRVTLPFGDSVPRFRAQAGAFPPVGR